jgi:4-aminobutyrate aminotransferase-like enzyme
MSSTIGSGIGARLDAPRAAPAESGEQPPLGPQALLEKRRAHLLPWTKHFFTDPPQIVRGELQHLFDHRGKRYLDFFAGVAVMNLGHSHPEVAAAACRAAQTLQHTTTIYLTQPIVDLAEALAAVAPGGLSRCFFTTSGSEANEAAALVASHATGRHELVALEHGLHGRTKLAMSLTGLSFWRADRSPVGGIARAPAPYCFRCPFGATYPACDLACARAVESVIRASTSGEPAAMIVEPILGNGGIIDPPQGYFEAVKEILDRHGALLIADEVQTGFGRTGTFFAIEQHGVAPDVLTLAKALGNGFPIGALITRPDIAEASERPGASTLGGSPFTASVALSVLEIHRRERLAERAARLGAYLKSALLDLKERFPLIGDVRGRGLMLGAELVRAGKAPAPAETDAVLEAMKDRGVFIGKTGRDRNVLTFQPPLIIDEGDIDAMLVALEDSLRAVETGFG